MALITLPLFSIGELLRRIAAVLKIDVAELARGGIRVIGVWLLAFLAYRILWLLGSKNR